MEINLYLLLSLLIALLVISYLLGKLHRVRGQLFLIRDALNDIKAGNLNRRVLVRESDLTKQICYDINEIAMSSQSRLIQQKQSEQAYKRLMTSLSHDVKTPLAFKCQRNRCGPHYVLQMDSVQLYPVDHPTGSAGDVVYHADV